MATEFPKISIDTKIAPDWKSVKLTMRAIPPYKKDEILLGEMTAPIKFHSPDTAADDIAAAMRYFIKEFLLKRENDNE